MTSRDSNHSTSAAVYTADPSVCANEAFVWRNCIEAHVNEKPSSSPSSPSLPSPPPLTLKDHCDPHANAFDACVAEWRKVVGPSVFLKGERKGEPPVQCAPLSCQIEACLSRTRFDFEKCKVPSEYFKRCVKGLYGSEYIM